MKDKFIAFLKKKKILIRYKKIIKPLVIDDLFNKTWINKPETCVKRGHIWGDDFDFWDKLDDEWQEIVNNTKN